MKNKIISIVIIILSISYSKNIYAETYYGEYRKVNSIGNYYDDTVKIDKYKLYNTYKTEYKDLGYLKENEEYIKDENDFIEELVEVNDGEESDEYIVINTSLKSHFQFIFYEIPIGSIINELEIYNGDNKIVYYINNKHKFGDIINNIYDSDYNTKFIQNFNLNLSILFDKKHNLEDLKIVFYTDKSNDFNMKMLVKDKIDITLKNNNKRKHIITFKYDELLEKDFVSYKYKIYKKLYKYYKEEKIKLNNYVSNGNNILTNDYIEVQDLYIRDKLVLKDNFIINNNNIKIDDVIEYSTGEVNINCNIDYNVNDIYKCNFTLNDINISKDILVDIPKNDTKEEIFKEETKTSYKTEKEIKSEEVFIEKNIKKTKEQSTKKIYKTIKKITTIKKINEKTEAETKKIFTSSNKDANQHIKNKIINIIKYIIFLNLILIEIIIFMKRKRNNVE